MPWNEHKSAPTSSKMIITIYSNKSTHCPNMNSEKYIQVLGPPWGIQKDGLNWDNPSQSPGMRHYMDKRLDILPRITFKSYDIQLEEQ